MEHPSAGTATSGGTKRRRVGDESSASSSACTSRVSHASLDGAARSKQLRDIFQTTKLWLTPPPAKPNGCMLNLLKSERLRSPAEVARLRFFAAPRTDATAVEGEILLSLLWALTHPACVPADVALDLSSQTLWERVEALDGWPSAGQLESVWGACRVLSVDLARLAPDAAGFDATLGEMADWLGRADRRTWRNRCVAAAVAVRMGKVKQKCGEERGKDEPLPLSQAFQSLLVLPGGVLGAIFDCTGTSALRLFASTSSRSRRLVRETPELSVMWRRNLFFAHFGDGGYLDTDLGWSFLCAED